MKLLQKQHRNCFKDTTGTGTVQKQTGTDSNQQRNCFKGDTATVSRGNTAFFSKIILELFQRQHRNCSKGNTVIVSKAASELSFKSDTT